MRTAVARALIALALALALPAWAATSGLDARIASLEQRMKTEPPADEWEKGRREKEIDDLRVEQAAEGMAYRKLEYRSSDGLAIPAYFFEPPAPPKGRAPAVIYAHGSQHGQFNSKAVPRMAAMTARGWRVIAPDYRSSAGYTKAFHDAADYGGLEIDDMLAAREFLLAQPGIDPKRIAIVGLSHGGYNAVMALARAPGSFAAGADFFGPTDLLWRLTAGPGVYPYAEPGDREYFARMIGKDVAEAPELYRARSPRYLADRIRDPLIILHGEKDSVVPLQESAWLAEALTKAGNRDFAFHVIRDGEHGYPLARMDEAWSLALEFLGAAFGEANQKN